MAHNLLLKVAVAAENNAGYDRAKFQDWVDADHDCQNTRHEVLISESRVTPNPLDVDIDHHVPLTEAWGSGGRGWTAAERAALSRILSGSCGSHTVTVPTRAR